MLSGGHFARIVKTFFLVVGVIVQALLHFHRQIDHTFLFLNKLQCVSLHISQQLKQPPFVLHQSNKLSLVLFDQLTHLVNLLRPSSIVQQFVSQSCMLLIVVNLVKHLYLLVVTFTAFFLNLNYWQLVGSFVYWIWV